MQTKGLRPPPPHPFIVPPGMAYAARCANEAMLARLEREEEIFDDGLAQGRLEGEQVAL